MKKLTRQDLIERLRSVGYTSLSRLRKDELEDMYKKIEQNIKREESKLSSEETKVSFREPLESVKISIPASLRESTSSKNVVEKKKPPTIYYEEEFEKLRFDGISKYVKLSQLGQSGKEGTTYLVMDPAYAGKRYAMKCFRKTKSENRIAEEAHYQWLVAKYGIAPQVYQFNTKEKYILMEPLDQTLLSILTENKGIFPKKLQQEVIELYKKLDETGIAVNDGNPRNIMEKNGKLYMIDYGLAKMASSPSFRKLKTPNLSLLPNALLYYVKERFDTTSWVEIRQHVPPESLQHYDKIYRMKNPKK